MRTAMPLLFLALGMPLASASSSIDFMGLSVRIDDGRGSDCIHAMGICTGNADGSGSFGNATVDVDQRLSSIGAAFDASQAEEYTGDSNLLPDSLIYLRGDDLYIRQPIIPLVTQSVGPHTQHEGTAPFVRIIVRGDGFCICWGTLIDGGEKGIGTTWSETGWVRYDAIGPFNAHGNSSTDRQVLYCEEEDTSCGPVTRSIHETYANNTPNVRYGFGFEDAQLATDPAALNASGIGTRAMRGDAALPPRAPPQALPLPTPVEPAGASTLAGPSASVTPRHIAAPEAVHQAPRPPGPSKITADDLSRRTLHPLPAAAAASAAGAALLALAIALYHRLDQARDICASPRRRDILRVVEESPGILNAEIARRLQLDPTTIGHHLRVLARADLVHVVVTNGRSAVYPGGAEIPAEHAERARIGWSDAAQRALQLVRASTKPIHRDDIHDALADVPLRTRNHALARLEAAGLIERVQKKRFVARRTAAGA